MKDSIRIIEGEGLRTTEQGGIRLVEYSFGDLMKISNKIGLLEKKIKHLEVKRGI